jgi:hypothetical protein
LNQCELVATDLFIVVKNCLLYPDAQLSLN